MKKSPSSCSASLSSSPSRDTHLDMKTIQHLASQGTEFYVGLGVGWAATDQHVQVVTPRVGEVVEVGEPFKNVEWYKLAR